MYVSMYVCSTCMHSHSVLAGRGKGRATPPATRGEGHAHVGNRIVETDHAHATVALDAGEKVLLV